MIEPGPPNAASSPARARARIIAPVAADMRAAGFLTVASGAVWPLEAAAIAWAVVAMGGRRIRRFRLHWRPPPR